MIKYIDIHTHGNEQFENVLSVINLSLPSEEIHDGSFFSAGWHPWNVDRANLMEIKSSILKVIGHEKLIALGECGLDRVSASQWNKQLEVFHLHLQLAKEYNKPMIVHNVKAGSDLLNIFKKENFKGKIILHGFSGNDQMARQFMNYNTWFSFGKLLFNPGSKLSGVIKYIPHERLFLESDEADYSISSIYLRAAEMLEIPVGQLCERIKNNFNDLTGYGLVG